MRADRKKTIAKVAKVVLAEPLLTERQVAEKAGVGKSTVNRIKNEVGQLGAKDDRIIGLTEGDFEIMKQIQTIKKKRLGKEEEVNNQDIDRWENTAVKRYTIFRGNATDGQGGLNNITFGWLD